MLGAKLGYSVGIELKEYVGLVVGLQLGSKLGEWGVDLVDGDALGLMVNVVLGTFVGRIGATVGITVGMHGDPADGVIVGHLVRAMSGAVDVITVGTELKSLELKDGDCDGDGNFFANAVGCKHSGN